MDYDYDFRDHEFLAKHYQTLIDTINSLELTISEPLYNIENFENGAWDYVCYNLNWFLLHITEAHAICNMMYKYGRESFRFLDVGCGIGTKVALASKLFDAYGIEHDKNYAKVAKKLTKKKTFFNFGRFSTKEEKSRIKVADAMKFPNYGQFNVIYFFRPLSKDDTQTELETKIFKDAREGTLIIPIYSISEFPSYINKLNTPNGRIFLKSKNHEGVQVIQKKVDRLFDGKKYYDDPEYGFLL